MELALGFRPHTGWAIAVLVGGDPAEPRVLHRDRVVLCPPALPRQVFHAVQHQTAQEATRTVDAVAEAVEQATRAVIDDLLARAQAHGSVTAAGLVGEPREVPELARVLRSHALLHLAEGQLYLGALDDEVRRRGLAVTMAPPRRTVLETSLLLGPPGAGLPERLVGLRRALGPPWQGDHRQATAAALLALAQV